MEKINIEPTINPKEYDLKQIEEGISRYNNSKIGIQKYTPVGCFARLDGEIVGGIKGNLFWNYLYIDMMWVDEKYRHRGIGKKLIDGIENLSMENGIFRSHLCSASFQAPEFYVKCGYRIIGRLDEMPEGETEYYLFKKLELSKKAEYFHSEIDEINIDITFEELEKEINDNPAKSDIYPIEQ